MEEGRGSSEHDLLLIFKLSNIHSWISAYFLSRMTIWSSWLVNIGNFHQILWVWFSYIPKYEFMCTFGWALYTWQWEWESTQRLLLIKDNAHESMIPDILVVNWFVAGGPKPLAVLARMVKEYVVPGYSPKNRKWVSFPSFETLPLWLDRSISGSKELTAL